MLRKKNAFEYKYALNKVIQYDVYINKEYCDLPLYVLMTSNYISFYKRWIYIVAINSWLYVNKSIRNNRTQKLKVEVHNSTY